MSALKKFDPLKRVMRQETRWGIVSSKRGGHIGLLKGPEWDEPILYRTRKETEREIKDIDDKDCVATKVTLTYYSPR